MRTIEAQEITFNSVSEVKVLELVHSLLAISEHYYAVVLMGIYVVLATYKALVSRLFAKGLLPSPLRRRSRVGHRKVILAIMPERGLPSHFLHRHLQGVGKRPAREGRAGQAGTAGSRPRPFSLCGLGTTSSSRPAGARPAQCGGCKDSPLPHTA